jgi:hypothetical protein
LIAATGPTWAGRALSVQEEELVERNYIGKRLGKGKGPLQVNSWQLNLHMNAYCK